jgi:hypothetical protein
MFAELVFESRRTSRHLTCEIDGTSKLAIRQWLPLPGSR